MDAILLSEPIYYYYRYDIYPVLNGYYVPHANSGHIASCNASVCVQVSQGGEGCVCACRCVKKQRCVGIGRIVHGSVETCVGESV